MFRDERPWQERQAEADKFRKLCTCPVCGKQIKEWSCFHTPSHGMIACGQWYCSRKHWAADTNSSFYKNPRYSRMSRLYLRFEQLRKKNNATSVQSKS